MNRYSKIMKSRASDSSDPLFPSKPKTPTGKNGPNGASRIQEETKNAMINGYGSDPDEEIEDQKHPSLRRNSSVSSSYHRHHQRFRVEGEGSVVRRAFSMRKSSSVSERYSRIHDQCVSLASPFDEEIESVSMENKKGGKKIFRACRRLLGLH